MLRDEPTARAATDLTGTRSSSLPSFPHHLSHVLFYRSVLQFQLTRRQEPIYPSWAKHWWPWHPNPTSPTASLDICLCNACPALSAYFSLESNIPPWRNGCKDRNWDIYGNSQVVIKHESFNSSIFHCWAGLPPEIVSTLFRCALSLSHCTFISVLLFVCRTEHTMADIQVWYS